MFYSKAVISSGDSMAREGAMLGVPSIYCGKRNMKANDLLIKKNILFKKIPEDIVPFLILILKDSINIKSQSEIREGLLYEWNDVTQFIVDEVNKFKVGGK